MVIFEDSKTEAYMDTQSLKIDLIHWLTQLKDQNILKKIQAIKAEADVELSPAQEDELEKRLEKYEQGEMQFKSWEETKAGVRKRAKNAL